MALPETNITTTAVRNAIGGSNNNIGQLCIHTGVNKWSRKKPVYRQNSTPSNWYKGYDNDFSLNIVESVLSSLAYNTNSQWSYTKPNATYGYRLGDFRGYNHSSVPPVYTSSYPSGSYLSNCSPPTFGYTKNTNTANGITPADLSYDDWYFGIMVEWVGSSYSNKAFITDTATLSGTLNVLPIDFDAAPFNISAGTYRWKSFITDTAISSWTKYGDLTIDQLSQSIVATVADSPYINTSTFSVVAATLVINPSSYEFDVDGETKDFGITTFSTNEWEASLEFPGLPWCSIDTGYDSDTGNGIVRITADPNYEPAQSATLRLSSSIADVTCSLTQPA